MSNQQRFIQVCTQAEFIHQYVDAPEEVSFLRYPHRHMLHITVEIEVFHDDRELEFILVKRALDKVLGSFELTTVTNRSCEQIGHQILAYLRLSYGSHRNYKIVVSEDGENASILYFTKEED